MFEDVSKEKYAMKEGSSIQLTDRDDRSYMMSVIQFIVRRFRSRIMDGSATHEDGSPELNPSKSKLRGCTLSKRTLCDINIYDIIPHNKLSETGKRRIYYFAGGSWQQPPSNQHWSFCSKLAVDLPDTIVSMVSMPLAPNNPASKSFPWCMKLYRAIMAEAEQTGDNIIFAGDSSGANMALCLPLEALREDEGKSVKTPYPVAIMAISPSTDLTRTNPDIDRVARYDPLLTPEAIRRTASAWNSDWDPADPRLSPINADISLLAKYNIKVHGVTSGNDVLAPDGIKFRNKCAEFNVQGQWLHWEKQMHCFVLTLPYGLREAKEGTDWIIEVLKKD